MGKRDLRYIKPGGLFKAIAEFDPKNATTRGEFFIDMPYNKADVEWNHMDQLHRPFVHRTYHDNIRMALGRDFALSLTRWGKWPFLISVTDVRVDEGLYYQNLVLAGMIFIHNTISMTQIEPDAKGNTLRLRLEWIIHSHRFLKPLHAVLSRMFYKLNVRLQEEDADIRATRTLLRAKGYGFLSDPSDYYSANQLTNNTIYPLLPLDAVIRLDDVPMHQKTVCSVGDVDFLVLRREEETLLWPAVCPHEGGNLKHGRLHGDCRMECPWHGLKFIAASLSAGDPVAEAYGFAYRLEGNVVHIRKV